MTARASRRTACSLCAPGAIRLVWVLVVASLLALIPWVQASSALEEETPRIRVSPREGLVWESPDGYPRLHLGGLFALDYLQYDPDNTRDSGLRLDRALILFDGSYHPQWTWWVAGDLKGIDTQYGLDEAWLSYEKATWFRTTAGLIEIPLGPEYAIPEADLSFVGYAFPAFLDGRTDIGIRLEGEIWDGFLSYDIVGAIGEGFDLLGQAREDPQVSVWVVSYPFRSIDIAMTLFSYEIPLLSGAFISGAWAYTPSYDGHLDVANPLRNKLFDLPRLEADSSQFFHVAGGTDAGPFRIMAELVAGSLLGLETPAGEVDLEDQIRAWQATFSWMVTGEPYDSRPFRRRQQRSEGFPSHPFGGKRFARDLGALEIAIRYSNADIDRRLFWLGFTDYTTSSQEFRTFSAAVNWYPVTKLRFTGQVVRTLADQYPAAFESHGRDTSFVFRCQYAF